MMVKYTGFSVSDIYTPDKQLEATLVYQTADEKHPGVKTYITAGMYMSAGNKVDQENRASAISSSLFGPSRDKEGFR
ncbi:hypothetical protein KEH51_03055 [[Brevibacterium] frigoritolerans]|uniref:ATP-sulfurylase PUA-like domain-containing protein n=1 Tax=Peribacillus frigoritolerans TaxID=450367 RepID=A0A941FFX9_9BACI|nr:hypothetical protein [Peribacillus frigoritolerans]